MCVNDRQKHNVEQGERKQRKRVLVSKIKSFPTA